MIVQINGNNESVSNCDDLEKFIIKYFGFDLCQELLEERYIDKKDVERRMNEYLYDCDEFYKIVREFLGIKAAWYYENCMDNLVRYPNGKIKDEIREELKEEYFEEWEEEYKEDYEEKYAKEVYQLWNNVWEETREEIKKEFLDNCNWFIEMRKGLGYSQRELAQKISNEYYVIHGKEIRINTLSNLISKFERGERVIPYKYRKAYSIALNISYEDFDERCKQLESVQRSDNKEALLGKSRVKDFLKEERSKSIN